MIELAQHAERLGYRRFWLAEHHNMPGIASAATAVLIGHVAGATSTIRVGAGGIMLPNHAPLQVAEQFGTLESLFPGRIDLGLGRAPGTDQAAARALRRYYQGADEFPNDVLELLEFFEPVQPGQPVQAVPGAGLGCESGFSAPACSARRWPRRWACRSRSPRTSRPPCSTGARGLPRAFQPSARLQRPYVMLGLNVVAADTDAEARRLFTSQQLGFINLRRGRPGLVQPPVDDIKRSARRRNARCRSRARLRRGRRAGTVARGVAAFVARHRPDELMLTANVFDHAARLRSFELAASVLM